MQWQHDTHRKKALGWSAAETMALADDDSWGCSGNVQEIDQEK
jgi:hypothetical protein